MESGTAPRPDLEFLILGPLEVRSDGRALGLRSAKQRALLATLLLHANEVVSSDRLIDDLWQDKPPDSTTNLLQVHVSQLRKTLDPEGDRGGHGLVITRPPGYMLRVDPARIDSVRFERLVNEGIAALATGEPDRAAATLEQALALWRGSALADFAFDEFARSESGRLEELRLMAIEERIEASLAIGRHAALIGELEAIVAEHPLRERPAGQLMLALYRSGRQAEALEAYGRTRKRLVDELGIEPSPVLQRLERAMLNHDPSLELPEPAAAVQPQPAGRSPEETREPQAEPAQATRKIVTVLFADFVLTPTRAQTVEPETLEPVFAQLGEQLTKVVETHGGSIHWSSEIEIVAVFGIPRVHEDDALRAVRAAVEMRKAIASLGPRLDADFGVRVDVRIGVNTGEVVAGVAFASPAMGGASSVAARLGRAAPVGDIVIADPTKDLVRDAILCEPAGPDRRAGWRLLDVVAGAAGIERRLSSPTVGRNDELQALRQAYDSVVQEARATLVTVLGPAGIGKSHLARAFVDALGDDCRVLQGRCLAYGEGSTFAPLAQVVSDLGGEQPLDAIRAILAGDDDRDVITERIAAAIGLSDSGGQTDTTFWAVRKLLEALAQDRPVVVALDDLHWADPTFLDLVEYIVDWTVETPVLVLGLARPELLDARPGLAGGKPNLSSLLLKPLDDAESERLIDNVLRGSELDDRHRARIREAAGGNPFFLEQMLALHAVENGDVRVPSLPPTIQALLAARIDRLDPEPRAVLERASIMGKEFWVAALSELSDGEGRESLGPSLRELVRKQLVEPCRSTMPAGGDALRFHSGLIRDAVYESVPKRSRAVLHERVADWLAQTVGAQVGQHEEVLGYHLELAFRYREELGPLDDDAGGVGARAAAHLASAGRRAFARGEMPVAAGLLERATGLMPSGDPARLSLLPTLGEAQHDSGRFAAAKAVLDAAVEAAGERDDPALGAKARVIRALVQASSGAGEADDAIVREAQAAIPIFEQLEDDAGLATAFRMLAWSYGTTGRYGDAAEAARRAIEHADLAGDARQHGRAATLYALAALHGPTPVSEALARCREIVDEVAGDRRAEGLVTVVLGWLEAMRGNFDVGRTLAERARSILDDLGSGPVAASTVSCQIEMLAEDPAAAERELRRDFEALTELGETYLRSTVAGELAQALYMQTRYEEALELTQVAEELAADDDVTSQFFWRSVRAKVLARRGSLGEGLALASEAVELVRQTDALVTTSWALVDLAEVNELAGRPDVARAALAEAVSLLERKENAVAARQAAQRLAAAAGPRPLPTS